MHGKTLNPNITTINLKYLLPLGMMNLICLMDHIQLQTFRITLNLSSKNMKLWLKILPYKFTPIKSKTVVFIIKTGYKLELLFPETMKLLGSTKKDVDKDKDGEDVPKLESVEVVLVHCNLVNNSYQQASKVLFTFVPNKQFGRLVTISPHSLIMLKTTNVEFQSVELWFTDQNNRPLEIKDSVNITLIIG